MLYCIWVGNFSILYLWYSIPTLPNVENREKTDLFLALYNILYPGRSMYGQDSQWNMYNMSNNLKKKYYNNM